MFKYLPSNVYAKLIDVIDNGATLDRSIANAVADGMKRSNRIRGDPLYTLVPAADRRYSRKA